MGFKSNITINTDTSFNYNPNKAGFAFWITCPLGRYKRYGKLNNCKDINDAEIQAIGNAIYFVLMSGLSENTIHKIYVNTDSKSAIAHITRKWDTYPASSKVKHYMERLKGKTNHRTLKSLFDFRHVKAHSGTESKRKYVNDWCDKMSKIGRNMS